MPLGDVLTSIHAVVFVFFLTIPGTTRLQRCFFGLLLLIFDAYSYFIILDEIILLQQNAVIAYCRSSLAAMGTLVVIDVLLLTDDPQVDIRKPPSEQDFRSMASRPFVERLRWSANVVSSCRKIGFTNQVSHVPPFRGSKEKWPFVFAKSRELVMLIIRLGFCWGITLYMGWHRTIMMNDPPADSLLGILMKRALSTPLVVLTSYTAINASYLAGSVALVAIGMTEPKEWPPLFGDFKEFTSVRKGWGYDFVFGQQSQSISKSLSQFFSQ